MASIDEARAFASLIKDKNRIKNQIGGLTDVQAILKTFREHPEIQMVNMVITQVDYSASNVLILDHPTKGLLNTGVLTTDSLEVTTDIVRRRYEWRKREDLDNGTFDPNVSIEDGRLRLR